MFNSSFVVNYDNIKNNRAKKSLKSKKESVKSPDSFSVTKVPASVLSPKESKVPINTEEKSSKQKNKIKSDSILKKTPSVDSPKPKKTIGKRLKSFLGLGDKKVKINKEALQLEIENRDQLSEKYSEDESVNYEDLKIETSENSKVAEETVIDTGSEKVFK